MKHQVLTLSLTFFLPNCGQKISQSEVKSSSTTFTIKAHKLPIIRENPNTLNTHHLVSASLTFACRKQALFIPLDNPLNYTTDKACDLLKIKMVDNSTETTTKDGYINIPLLIDGPAATINIPQLLLTFANGGLFPEAIACIYLHLNYKTLGEYISDTQMIRGVNCNHQLTSKNKPRWLNEDLLGIGTFFREKPDIPTQVLPTNGNITDLLYQDGKKDDIIYESI